jgi:hypothetical protein
LEKEGESNIFLTLSGCWIVEGGEGGEEEKETGEAADGGDDP